MNKQTPKGKLIAVGGSEDKGTEFEPGFIPKNYLDFFELGILKRVLHEMKGLCSHVEVITTASIIPEEVGEMYVQAFGKLKCENMQLMHIKQKADTENPEFLERIKKADGVFFTGGNQSRLSSIFGGTEFLEILRTRYMNESFVIAGTSAGAMAMSDVMISQGSGEDALLKGAVQLSKGFGLIDNVIIDTHFVKRGRFGRLTEAVTMHPQSIGIGLGEDTGILITEGNKIETIGSRLVMLFDAHEVKYSNVNEAEEGMPLSIQHMVFHVMSKGNCYILNERKFSAHYEGCTSFSEAEKIQKDKDQKRFGDRANTFKSLLKKATDIASKHTSQYNYKMMVEKTIYAISGAGGRLYHKFSRS